MPKLDRHAPTQRPSRSQKVSPPSSAGMPPGPNSSGWRRTMPASTIRPAAAYFTNSGLPPPNTMSTPAPTFDARKARRASATSPAAPSGTGREKPAAISDVQRRCRSSRQCRSNEAAYSEARVRAISAAPPGERQSTSTSRPCRAMCARNARPNSVRIDSLLAVMMTSVSCATSAFGAAVFRERATNGTSSTTTSAAIDEARGAQAVHRRRPAPSAASRRCASDRKAAARRPPAPPRRWPRPPRSPPRSGSARSW